MPPALKPHRCPHGVTVALGGTGCCGHEGHTGAVLLLLSSHRACGDLAVCPLLGCSCQPALQLWGCAPGHPPLPPLFPEVCRGRAGLPGPPWFPPYLCCHGAQLALSFPAIPGGCVENEWKRQLAVLACPLTSPRKNVSDFSLTLWAGREEGLLKLQSLPCPAWEGAARLLLSALLIWAGICSLLFSAGSCSAFGPEAAGGPMGAWEIPSSSGAPDLLGVGVCVPSACQPEEGAGSEGS